MEDEALMSTKEVQIFRKTLFLKICLTSEMLVEETQVALAAALWSLGDLEVLFTTGPELN